MPIVERETAFNNTLYLSEDVTCGVPCSRECSGFDAGFCPPFFGGGSPNGGVSDPFLLRRTPSGVYAGLSFACRSVREQTGAPVETCRALLESRLGGGPSDRIPGVSEIASPVRFDDQTEIEWDLYLRIESVLDRILSFEDRDLETCLIAGHVWLGMLRQVLVVFRMKAAAGGGGAGGEPLPGMRQVIERYIEQVSAEGFDRCFRIAERPAANPATKRMVLGTFISFRQALKPGLWRLTAMARVGLANLRHWARLGTLRFPPLDGTIPYAQFKVQSDELGDPDTSRLLRRYFRHALFRKDLVVHSDVFAGYGYLVLVYGLIQWYAAALRLSGRADPGRALACVESHYVLHPAFGQSFWYHPALADILQYAAGKPTFAHSIIRG
jgi:hypothetical protein